jgi:hypothetical protein
MLHVEDRRNASSLRRGPSANVTNASLRTESQFFLRAASASTDLVKLAILSALKVLSGELSNAGGTGEENSISSNRNSLA